jgi:hypothetical protein
MARPRKSRATKQSVKLVLSLTPAEKKRLEAAAAKDRLPVATAARLYAMRAIDRGEDVV